MSKETNGVPIALVSAGVLLLGWFAFCELALARPISVWFYVGVTLLLTVALVWLRPVRFQWVGLGAWGILVVLTWTVYVVDWTTRKTFLRDLGRVHQGMTEAEVRGIMSGYMEGTGWPSIPGSQGSHGVGTLGDTGGRMRYATQASSTGELVLQDSLTFRHSRDSAFNSDWGIISLSNGRVVRVSFSPD